MCQEGENIDLVVIQQSLKSLDFHIDPVMIPVRDKGWIRSDSFLRRLRV